MQKRFLKVEIVIWVSGRNVMTSPPFRCLHFFKPQQLFLLHQSLVLCGWQRSGGFSLTRGWLLLGNDWHAAAFLKAVHGRSVPPFVLLLFILILLLQFSRTPFVLWLFSWSLCQDLSSTDVLWRAPGASQPGVLCYWLWSQFPAHPVNLHSLLFLRFTKGEVELC